MSYDQNERHFLTTLKVLYLSCVVILSSFISRDENIIIDAAKSDAAKKFVDVHNSIRKKFTPECKIYETWSSHHISRAKIYLRVDNTLVRVNIGDINRRIPYHINFWYYIIKSTYNKTIAIGYDIGILIFESTDRIIVDDRKDLDTLFKEYEARESIEQMKRLQALEDEHRDKLAKEEHLKKRISNSRAEHEERIRKEHEMRAQAEIDHTYPRGSQRPAIFQYKAGAAPIVPQSVPQSDQVDQPPQVPQFNQVDQHNNVELPLHMKKKMMKFDSDDRECAICLETIDDERELYVAKCFHLYHIDCMKQWNAKKGRNAEKCPTCENI